MDFPEQKLKNEIFDRLKANSAYFTDHSHEPPAHLDWDRNQYSDEDGRKDYPFPRPAIFIKYGKMPYAEHGPFSKRGTIPILITVVQDKIGIDSADGMYTASFDKLIEYKYLVNDVLEYWKGTCFTAMQLKEIETDHNNRSLHVETILYEVEVTLKRKSTAP